MTDWGPERIKGTCAAVETCRCLSWVGPALSLSPALNPPGCSGTWRLMCLGTCYTGFCKSTQSDSPHPKEIYKPAKAEPFTSVNVFNLAAFLPLLHSISANILTSKRAGSDVQRNSSFQGKNHHSIFLKANFRFACFGAPAGLNKLDNEGKGSAVQARCPRNAAHTQPIDGICELQQPSSPEIWSLLPRALGVAQSRHCAHRAFKKKELKREIWEKNTWSCSNIIERSKKAMF